MIPPVASRPPVSPSRVANTRCHGPGLRPSCMVQMSNAARIATSTARGTRRNRHRRRPPRPNLISYPDTVAGRPPQVSEQSEHLPPVERLRLLGHVVGDAAGRDADEIDELALLGRAVEYDRRLGDQARVVDAFVDVDA